MNSPPTQPTAVHSKHPDWLIIGHGALASLWAHHLAASGQSLAIVIRAATAAGVDTLHGGPPDTQVSEGGHNAIVADPISRLSLTIDNHAGPTHTREFTAYTWSNLHTLIHPNTRVLVMVKAWQLDNVIEQLAISIQQADCMPLAVILSHNGIGAAESLLQRKLELGWPIFDLITTHGAWRKHSRYVVHAGAGSSMLGPRQRAANTSCLAPPLWFYTLANALPPLAWEPDILTRRWHKLAINCAINPLATLAKQPNGVLLNPLYHADIRAICSEIEAVANQVLGPEVLSASELEAQVHQVISATQHNTCSMLQDVQSNNPTEIDYLNGYVAKLAAALALPAPVNQRLAHAIKHLTFGA